MRDTPIASRAPVASSALLTAALGGLFCLSVGCDTTSDTPGTDAAVAVDTGRDTGSAPTDTGSVTDTPAPSDTPVAADTAAPSDTPLAADTSATADAGAGSDAPALSDTPVATDTAAPVDVPAPMDVSAPLDAAVMADASPVADGSSPDVPFICDVQPDRVVTYSDASTGMTFEQFRAMCDRVGGFIETHPHCGGANSCAGFSWDQTINTYTEHSCQGLNTCTGYTCVRR